MQEPIYAYTESSGAPYPAYVSINQVSLDTVSITVRASGSDTSAEIVLPIKEMGVLSAQLNPYNPYQDESFLFELGEEVEIAISGERGRVVARAEYEGGSDSYLVHYKAANGCATNGWFSSDVLEPVFANEDDVSALPTDAEIPHGFEPLPPA